MKAPPRPGLARVLHWLFEMSLAIKAVLTGAEAATGLGLLFTPNPMVARLRYWITHYEIADRPGDTMASLTQRAVAQFPVSTQDFYAWYLIFHGGIKLLLVVMLWSRVLWAYPAAMVVLGGFVSYEIYEFLHSHSPFLLLLSFFDLFMIALIWQEYKALKRKRSAKLELA
ncbi:MAG: DUF2127 domain-containing protein [Cypionkella sp.]|jgi:uncharacterized membrane protein